MSPHSAFYSWRGNGKRLSRERPQLKKKRTPHINRIRALLILQDIRSVRGLLGGRWKNWLSSTLTRDGRVMSPFLLRELSRQFERLTLVHTQRKALNKEHVTACSTEGAINNRHQHFKATCRYWWSWRSTIVHWCVLSYLQKPTTSCIFYLGRTQSSYSSGEILSDQGISKAVNK